MSLSAIAVTNAEVDELLADAETLGSTAGSAAAFYEGLAVAMFSAVNAEGVVCWRAEGAGLRRVASNLANEQAAPAIPPRRLLTELADGGARVLSSGADDALLLACPIRTAGKMAAALVCRLPSVASTHSTALLSVVTAFGEVAEEFELRRRLLDLQGDAALAAAAQRFTLEVHQAPSLPTTTRAIAEEGRRLLAADRVTVLTRRGGRWRVAAVSGVEKPSPRSDAVRGVERLVSEAMRVGDAVWLRDGDKRDGDEQDHPPALARALQQRVDEGFARELVVLPCRRLADEDKERGRAEAALLVEQFDGTLPTAVERAGSLVCEHAAVAVERARYAGLLGSVRRRLAPIGLASGLFRLVVAGAVVGTIAVAGASLALVPAELKIAAEGRLVPAERARVFAPMDATVGRVLVGHGDLVAKGDVLVELRSETLEIELEQALEALATTKQEITALETAKLRAGLPGVGEPVDVSAVSSRIESLKEQTDFQSRRVVLLREQQDKLVIVSPLAGRVVSWRPQDSLAERPVRRGQRLLEVAATAEAGEAGGWVIEVDVPDHRAGHVLAAAAASDEGLVVDYVLKAAPAQALQGRVERVAAVTQANAEGEPVVRIEVDPLGLGQEEAIEGVVAADALTSTASRSGSTVLAKIRCGEHSLGYVWFHEAWETIQRFWF